MANGVPYNINETENALLRIASDHYDAIQIISRCPVCFEAYKSLIQKKRVASKDGGLVVESSQLQEGSIIFESH